MSSASLRPTVLPLRLFPGSDVGVHQHRAGPADDDAEPAPTSITLPLKANLGLCSQIRLLGMPDDHI